MSKNDKQCPRKAARQWRSGVGFSKPPLKRMASFHAVLGCRLRWLRIERGISRNTVAALLGIPLKLVVAQERGKRRIAPYELVAYSRFYKVKLSGLFHDLSIRGHSRP